MVNTEDTLLTIKELTDAVFGKVFLKSKLEFAFDFGLSLRAGLSSFTTFESFTVGAGVVVSKFLKVDYAFESHPVLSSVHRVSVSISPWLFFNEPKEKKLKQEKLEEKANEEPMPEIKSFKE